MRCSTRFYRSWRSAICHWLAMLLLLLPLSMVAQAAQEKAGKPLISIGVLAYSGKAQAVQRWQATADYLSKHVPSHRFTIVPLNLSELEYAINKQTIDFFLTNSGQYLRLERKVGASRLATMQTRFQQHILSHFSSVIFTRSDSGITQLEELRGKRLAAVSQQAFGGYLLAQQAFQQAGIDASQEVQLMWLGFPHADIVKAVLSGKADAGVVRAGVLEGMVQQKQLDWEQLRLLAEKSHADFPFRHSTGLSPEWPFARLPHTDSQLAKRVTLVLLQMPSDASAARIAGIAGWTIPLDYSKVYQVLSDLTVAPSPPAKANFGLFGEVYKVWVLGVLGVLLLGLLSLWRMFGINRKLRETQVQLERTIKQHSNELRQQKQALQEGVEARQLMEQNIDNACGALQHFYVTATRYDLTHQQRLQSMLDASRKFLGMDIALLLHGDEQHTMDLLISSPENYQASTPLNPHRVAQSILDKQLYYDVEDEQWQRYLVKPVITAQQHVCIFEFAQHPNFSDSATAASVSSLSDIHLRILDWITLWMESEQRCILDEHQNDKLIRNLQARFDTLSSREQQVLTLLTQGDSSKAMAEKLHLSPKTIELHRTNLLRKTNAKSSIHLVKLVCEAKWLDRDIS